MQPWAATCVCMSSGGRWMNSSESTVRSTASWAKSKPSLWVSRSFLKHSWHAKRKKDKSRFFEDA
jgi:hypothetical protein